LLVIAELPAVLIANRVRSGRYLIKATQGIGPGQVVEQFRHDASGRAGERRCMSPEIKSAFHDTLTEVAVFVAGKLSSCRVWQDQTDGKLGFGFSVMQQPHAHPRTSSGASLSSALG